MIYTHGKNLMFLVGDKLVVQLTRACFAMVDWWQFPKVVLLKWRAVVNRKRKTAYAYGCIPGARRQDVALHRLILGVDTQIDHKDRNGINCVDSNIRIANSSQNGQNKGIYRSNKTGFVGVYFETYPGKFRGSISIKGRTHNTTYFKTAEAAARARDALALKLHDPRFVRLNFPMQEAA